MPSVLVGLVSGGQRILSGFGGLWSGKALQPVGGVQLRWDRNASGNIYIALSGPMTVNSGGYSVSGGSAHSGLLDGMQIGPGGTYFVPRLGTGLSGFLDVFGAPEAAASGNRLYFEVF